MKTACTIMLAALLSTACRTEDPAATSAWQGDIQSWGTLREALRDGQDQGRVVLADVAAEGIYAVGALAGLRGEVTIVDGEVWISEGDAVAPVTSRGGPADVQADVQATVLFATDVGAWQEMAVEEPVDASEFDAFLAEQARGAGLDTTRPFPFVVEGGLSHLSLHVIAGECPIHGRMRGGDMASPPFELHAEQVEGRLVGFYAQDSAGVLCHMGSQTHTHALLEQDGGLTGHVETVGLARGATLRLPLP